MRYARAVLLSKTHAVYAGRLLHMHTAAGASGRSWRAGPPRSGSPEKHKARLAARWRAVIDTNGPDWTGTFLEADTVRDSSSTTRSESDASDAGWRPRSRSGWSWYGAASRPAPAVASELLNRNGCLYFTRPSAFPHNADPENGHVTADGAGRFQLDRIAEAHRVAEERHVAGAILITP